MIRKTPDTICFNKDKSMVIFSENGLEYSRSFAGFSKLLVSRKVSHTENGRSATYRLNLVSRNGSDLLLCESGEKAELREAAESILPYIDIDFFSGDELVHKGRGSYADVPPVFPPGEEMSIKSYINPGISVYRWNSRKSFAVIFLLGAVIFGFNFLFITWAFPAMSKFNPGVYAGGAVLVLLDIFFSATLLFNLFGSNKVEIADSVFSHCQSFLGFNINSKDFNREEIALVSSGFTSDENKITIFTKRGRDIFNGLKVSASRRNLNDPSALMSLIPEIMKLRKNIIEIDGTPLYYYEKLYLENEWSVKLNLENGVQAYSMEITGTSPGNKK